MVHQNNKRINLIFFLVIFLLLFGAVFKHYKLYKDRYESLFDVMNVLVFVFVRR